MANIKNHLNNIKNALFGQEVRGSIHDGLDAINKEIEGTTGRQVDLEKTFDQLVINAGNSNAEIVDARVKSDGTSYSKLGDRLNEVDSQLEHIEYKTDFEKADKVYVDNLVSSVASGSPRGVYTSLLQLQTSIPDGNNNIYITSDNGHWNYWNGTSWISGGVYQSVGLEDNSISESKLIGGVTNLNLYKIKINKSGYIDTDGVIQNSSAATYAQIPVLPTNRYLVWRGNHNCLSGKDMLIFQDNNLSVIGTLNMTSYIFGTYNGFKFAVIETPVDCAYISFNTKINAYDVTHATICMSGSGENLNRANDVMKIFNQNVYDIETDNKLNTLISSIKGSKNNIYDFNEHHIENYYASVEGSILGAYGWGCAKVPTNENVTYSLYLPCNTYTGLIGSIIFLDAYSKTLSYSNPSSLINGNKVNGKDYLTFTTPTNCKYVAFTNKRLDVYDNIKSSVLVIGDTITSDMIITYVSEINGLPVFTGADKTLQGKKWVVVGDSLTEKNIRTTKNYHDYVNEDTGIEVVNLGKSGTGYKKTEELNTAFYQRINQIPTDADIITFFGSGNDLSLTLGTPTDSTTDTICGCMNKTFETLFERIPGAKVGVVLPCPWGPYAPTIQDNKMMLYAEALREVAKRYSIPVLDLYYGSNLRPWDETFKELYYKRDDGNSVHPDEDGHKILANKFKMFIQSL